jgi:hypothetical protein
MLSRERRSGIRTHVRGCCGAKVRRRSRVKGREGGVTEMLGGVGAVVSCRVKMIWYLNTGPTRGKRCLRGSVLCLSCTMVVASTLVDAREIRIVRIGHREIVLNEWK